MGYSATKAAFDSLNVVLKAVTDPKGSSNTWKNAKGVEFFFEQGRENYDGAITGTVMKMLPGGTHCKRYGGVRIEPNGEITRFPGVASKVLASAEKESGEKFWT